MPEVLWLLSYTPAYRFVRFQSRFRMSKQCIIVGGSHAGAQVAISLRQEGWEDNILVISNESYLPYHRPPLSKGFVSGDKTLDDILLRPATYFEKHNVKFALNTNVDSINRELKQIQTSDGETRNYSKLALTTGARVRKIAIPGSDLQGIHYLRSAADAQAIQADAITAKHAVIVGGGYIGLELAASFRKAGMNVTVLEMAPRVLARVAAPEVADFYTRVHREEGVSIVTEASAESFAGKQRVEAVQATDGKNYPADIVIIGVGVIPNTELASDAGLHVDNGIVVNKFAQTSDPNIVAAGDCTYHPNALLGRRLRLESVPNATEQGKTAAASLCGNQKPYSSLPWFWSDQFDLKLQIAGFNEGYDQVVLRGDSTSSRSMAAFYLKENKVIAVDCINRAQEFAVVKKALTKGLAIRIEDLADESIKPKDLLVTA